MRGWERPFATVCGTGVPGGPERGTWAVTAALDGSCILHLVRRSSCSGPSGAPGGTEKHMIELRICIDVPDLDRGIDFYTRALGLRVGRRNASLWAELLGAGCPVDLLPVEAGSAASPVSPA